MIENGLEALSFIESYIAGISYKELEESISFICKNYVKEDISWGFSVANQSCDRFDNDIKAFAYFWNYKFGKKYNYIYDYSYIKAMIAVESSMGTNSGGLTHAELDVMQCFDARNPAVYCMAKIEPKNDVSYDANEGIVRGMRKDGYRAVRNIFVEDELKWNLITPRLSICFGILWLGYKTSIAGNIKDGVLRYNSNEEYLTKVEECVKNPKRFFGLDK